MPDQNGKPLPPLDKEAFDGEKERIELNFKRCFHKSVDIVNNELRCTCGAGWSGPNIAHLYKLLKEQ